MPVSEYITEAVKKSSWIRKMFEEGTRLKAIHGEDNVFDFSIGNPDADPPEDFFREFESASRSREKGVHGYMPNAGFNEVRSQIASMVTRDHGIDIASDSIIMTCGAAGGLNVLFKTILNPGDEIIVPAPYFVEYGFYTANHGGVLKPVKTDPDFSLNVGNIINAVTDKTAAVLINSPNNPTGRIYSEEAVTELSSALRAKSAGKRSIYLISDEPYRDIVFTDTKVPSILKHYEHSIVATSYSKTLSLPGERIGYLAVNPACDDFSRLMSGLVFSNRILGFVNAPALMQRIVGKLSSARVDINLYRKRRDMLVDVLKRAGYSFPDPEGAFYIFCSCPSDDDVDFVSHLQKYNILAVPGSGFGCPGNFRLTFCVSEKTIAGSFSAFKEALETYKAR